MIHQKCRQGIYPLSNIKRFDVPEDKVPWSTEFSNYDPVSYTAPGIQNKPWADPAIENESFNPKWNTLDGENKNLSKSNITRNHNSSFLGDINRQSFTGDYSVNENGYPLNPIGRSGIIGRGLLGRWGPNHAADPIVTRWKRNGTGALEIDKNTEKPILQFVAIQRQDSSEWAIPGGMVDPGETVSTTVMREFMEEAMNSLDTSNNGNESLTDSIKTFFQKGDQVFKGYVDDPRNTDNAWMETVAINFHDENGDTVGQLKLMAGDDASNVRWMDINRNLNLYANHCDFIKRAVHKHDAHW